MASNQNQSQQFKITEAVISADRLLEQDFDVRTSIVELNIFESLDKPYLTGQLIILDDNALLDVINFNGTERFKVTIASVTNDLQPVFERSFMMTGIERSVKSEQGKASILNITLMDEHAFLARSKRISRSFSGNIDDIVVKLIGSEMKKNIDTSYLGESKPIQTSMKGIIPNLNPIDAALWLTKRASTITGSPFFIYGSMHDDNIRFGNLDTMLSQDAFNAKLPYIYNPANVALAEQGGEDKKSFIVSGMKTTKMSNTLKIIEQGLVGSQYSNTNLNTGQIFSQHHTIRKTLEGLQTSNVIGKNQNVFDDEFRIGEQPIDDYNSMNFHTITSRGTYERHKSYHDEHDEVRFKKKIEINAIKAHLYKNLFNVVVPGVGLIVSKAGVGDIIKLNVINDDTNVNKKSTSDTMLDKGKSGDFLVYETRHIFSDTTHNVSMNICKLERQT